MIDIDISLENTTEDYSESFDKCIEAAAKWAEIVRTDENTILVDIDNGSSMDRYKSVLHRIADTYHLKETARWQSRSGYGWHIILTSDLKFTIEQRLLLQCCLGSDPIREAFGLNLHLKGVSNPIVLFKPKGQS